MIHAVPGMTLALPIYHPKRHGTTLLRAGVCLEEATIRRLFELGVHEAWIRCPGLEMLADYVSPSVHAACQQVAAAIGPVFDVAAGDNSARLEYAAYRRAVSGLLERLADHPAAALLVSGLSGAEPAIRHACNVCLTSVLVGLKLDFYLVRERPRVSAFMARDVSNLGVGALLHDVGMTSLPRDAIERWEQDHDESDEPWRRHVEIGFDMVRGDVDPSAAACVLHHHQHFDGSGFPTPEPLSGGEIHIFARIVTAADLLDRLRHAPEPSVAGGKLHAVPTVQALKRIQQRPYSDWIDPIVLRGLLAVVPPYPPGSKVKLTDGREGVVVDWNPATPCRPSVQLITRIRSHGLFEAVPGKVVVLSECRDLAVAEVDGVHVLDDNFEPVDPDGHDLEYMAMTMSPGETGTVSAPKRRSSR